MPAEPTPDVRVIAAYLDDVAAELDAASRLSAPPVSRFAAFHLQQAAEKLVKAVRLSRGLHATADHNIPALVGELKTDDEWKQSSRGSARFRRTRPRTGTQAPVAAATRAHPLTK